MVDENRRRATRKKFIASSKITIDGIPTFYTGLVKNISEGGLFVHTYNLLEPGTKVVVRFQDPITKETVEVPSVVKWIRSPEIAAHPEDVGYGVEFVKLPEKLKEHINQYIKKSETIFYIWLFYLLQSNYLYW